MRFGTWKFRSLHRTGAMKTVARELEKNRLDSVGVQEVRWEKVGTKRSEDYTFFYGEGNGVHQLGTCLFVQKRIVSAVKRVEYISDRMTYNIKRSLLQYYCFECASPM
jgi:hypothetical protein